MTSYVAAPAGVRPSGGGALRVLACLAGVTVVAFGTSARAFAADGAASPAPAANANPTSPATDAATPAEAGGGVEGTDEKAAATGTVDLGARRMALVPEVVPVVRPVDGLLRRSPWFCGRDQCLAPFWRDSDLRLHLRTFYFDRHNPNESINEAWALGGWLQYTSGWLADVFQIGATAYTSQPLYAPEDHDGTTLLAPGQEGISSLGQAYARFRYHDYAVLTAYRQSVNDGYVGPQDNRMIPNTFEGATLRGTVCAWSYDVGYLWDMKPRNSDTFIPMAQQAGVAGSDEGLWFGSLLWKPSDAWEAFAGTYYTPDVFNTGFVYAKHTHPLGGCAKAQFGAQYTDQRSVGEAQLGEFQTWNVGVGGRVVWDWGLTLGAAVHATGADANIRSSYGSWPGYLSLIETDFDRANEKAFGVGLKYDFGKCGPLWRAPGLLAVLAYGYGTDRENPSTGAGLPDTGEFDFDVTWDVPTVKGLQLRFRNAYVDSGGPDTGYQFRLIANWEIDLW